MTNILNKAVLLFLVISLSACGKKENPHVAIESQFASYVNNFQVRSQEQGRGVVIDNLEVSMVPTLDKLGSNVVGVCYRNVDGSGTPRVEISEEYWIRMDTDAREELMFHELGHCVITRGHRGSVDASGFPLSVMNPFIFSSYHYLQNYHNYMYELFNQRDYVAPSTSLAASVSELMGGEKAEEDGTTNQPVLTRQEYEQNDSGVPLLTDEELAKIKCHD